MARSVLAENGVEIRLPLLAAASCVFLSAVEPDASVFEGAERAARRWTTCFAAASRELEDTLGVSP
jgi:hypothetical protein